MSDTGARVVPPPHLSLKVIGIRVLRRFTTKSRGGVNDESSWFADEFSEPVAKARRVAEDFGARFL
jgi:hypothetical protein